jgi:hypothetical protein
MSTYGEGDHIRGQHLCRLLAGAVILVQQLESQFELVVQRHAAHRVRDRGLVLHHVLDPRQSLPREPRW